MRVERVLHAARDVNGIWCFVIAVNERAGSDAAGTRIGRRIQAGKRCGVHSLESCDPSVLREVVVKHAEPGADDSLATVSRRVSNADARSKLFAVVVRRAAFQRNVKRLQRDVSRIVELAAAGRVEQSESGLIAQSIVHGEVRCDAPGILNIQPEPLNILVKAAIQGRSRGGTSSQIGQELRRVAKICGWILWKFVQRFLVARESAA